MFSWLKTKMPEVRSGQIDLGALYQSVFFGGQGNSWSRSPAVLVASLSIQDNQGALLLESRRLGRTSPLLIAYRSVVECGVLTGEPEAPTFSDIVPDNVVDAVADMWTFAHDPQRERDLLDRVVVDGEFLEFEDGEIIPADGFEPTLAGPEWNKKVTGYKIGKSTRTRMVGLRYVGDRPMGAARALPWIAPALPSAAGLLNARTGAAHALGVMAKIASVIGSASPDRIAASAGARTGIIDDAEIDPEARQRIESLPIGSVPFLKAGEAIARVAAGPDEQARAYESQLESDVAAALNVPLSDLKSDYSSGSFSNLRMAWQDAERELTRRRRWWHRNYRLEIYLTALSENFASGDLPRMSRQTMAALKQPIWRGPRREPPQPEKEAASLTALVGAGILSPQDAKTELNS